MSDATCGPALVDIAAMRDALGAAGVDPCRLNPAVPVATSDPMRDDGVDIRAGRDRLTAGRRGASVPSRRFVAASSNGGGT